MSRQVDQLLVYGTKDPAYAHGLEGYRGAALTSTRACHEFDGLMGRHGLGGVSVSAL